MCVWYSSRTELKHWYTTLYQRCTGAGVSEWTPAGVLTIFENRSGVGVDFSKEGPEWSWSQFFNEVSLFIIDFYYCRLFFTKHVLTQGFPNWGTCTPSRGTFAYLKGYMFTHYSFQTIYTYEFV